MLIINRLTKAGGIRKVIIRPKTVEVRTANGEEIVYRRDESVPTSGEDTLRRSPLH